MKIVKKMGKKRSKSEIRFRKVLKSEYFKSGRGIFDFGMFRCCVFFVCIFELLIRAREKMSSSEYEV